MSCPQKTFLWMPVYPVPYIYSNLFNYLGKKYPSHRWIMLYPKDFESIDINRQHFEVLFLPTKHIGKIIGANDINYSAFLGLQHALDQIRPDLILTNLYYSLATLQGYWYSMAKGIPHIVMAEEKRLPPSRKKKWVALLYEKAIGNRILSRCRSVLAWSSDAYSFMKLRAPQGKVSLFLPGIDIACFQADPDMRFYQDGEISLLVVARLHPEKGYDVLLQALRFLHSEGVQFRLSILGQGDLKSDIQAEIHRNGLEHLIQFLPPIPYTEMAGVYRSHDLLILPSHRDPVGLCVPEAMACGIPAIVSTGAGAKDYIIPGETGLVFPAGDARALADCIKALANESQLQRMGRNAAADIREHYSLAHQADVLYAHLTG